MCRTRIFSDFSNSVCQQGKKGFLTSSFCPIAKVGHHERHQEILEQIVSLGPGSEERNIGQNCISQLLGSLQIVS